MTFDLFMVWSNLCPSCCGNTGRMLQICNSCFLSDERIVAHGPLVWLKTRLSGPTFICLLQHCDFLLIYIQVKHSVGLIMR